MYELVCQMYTMVLKYGCMYIHILIIAQQVLVRWYGRVHLATYYFESSIYIVDTPYVSPTVLRSRWVNSKNNFVLVCFFLVWGLS